MSWYGAAAPGLLFTVRVALLIRRHWAKRRTAAELVAQRGAQDIPPRPPLGDYRADP